MGPEKIALFDMDGTLCDYGGALERDLASLAAPEEDEYEPFTSHPKYIQNRIRLIRERSGWWRELEPIETGRHILNTALEIGFSIHILTNGPSNNPEAWKEKVEWCKNNLHCEDYNITITEDKGLVYGRVLVDDYPKYALRWLKWRPRGLVVMPVHQYNVGFDHPNVFHFDGSNIDELCKFLQGAYDR